MAHPPPPEPHFHEASAPVARGESRRFLRGAGLFLLIGAVLYGVVYIGAESLVRRYAQRNRFHVVQAADRATYDYVILGASHAAVFDYRDMNDRLEEMTGATILNLATVGGGLSINRLLLEYFLEEHATESVVYVLDSFAFYSREWNEERLRDVELYRRAPWDPDLALLLLATPGARAAALDYISGFSKINNPGRFEPDLFPGEDTRFERAYRPVAQIDRQRIQFLYPEGADLSAPQTRRYFDELDSLIAYVRSAGARVVVVRPPVPERMSELIPGEDAFDGELAARLAEHDVQLFDFSDVNSDDTLFYDSDHLNRDGALAFFENYLSGILTNTER